MNDDYSNDPDLKELLSSNIEDDLVLKYFFKKKKGIVNITGLSNVIFTQEDCEEEKWKVRLQYSNSYKYATHLGTYLYSFDC
jgi:hypothetical protein